MKLFFGLLVCFLAFTAPGLADGPRVALVVGVGNYVNAPRLRNTPTDAAAIGSKLQSLGFQVDQVIDPDRAELERAIRQFGDDALNSEGALFYYAGHAIESDGKNYLLPANAKIRAMRDLQFESISLDLIPAQTVGRARTILMFVDVCRDNPFAASLAPSGRGWPSSGLAEPISTAEGMLILYAASPGHAAADGNGDHSPFTGALLKEMDTPGLDVSQLVTRVRKDVRDATGGTQIPWESSSLLGEFYLHPASPFVPIKPAPRAPDLPAGTSTPTGPEAATVDQRIQLLGTGINGQIESLLVSQDSADRISGIEKIEQSADYRSVLKQAAQLDRVSPSDARSARLWQGVLTAWQHVVDGDRARSTATFQPENVAIMAEALASVLLSSDPSLRLSAQKLLSGLSNLGAPYAAVIFEEIIWTLEGRLPQNLPLEVSSGAPDIDVRFSSLASFTKSLYCGHLRTYPKDKLIPFGSWARPQGIDVALQYLTDQGQAQAARYITDIRNGNCP